MRMRQNIRGKKRAEESVDAPPAVEADTPEQETDTPVKEAKPVSPRGLLRRVINNPNLGYQMMVIMLTFLSDNVPMERRINNVNSSVEKIRNVTEVLNRTMESIKSASEAPRHIRKLLE